MARNENFHDVFMELLWRYGTVEATNPITVCSIYEDKKVRLVGVMKPEDGGWRYKTFSLALKIPSKDQSLKIMGLESKPGDTVVYFARVRYVSNGQGYTHVEFYRPGRWEDYIKKIVRDGQEQSMELRKLDNTPIEDDTLFPESDQ